MEDYGVVHAGGVPNAQASLAASADTPVRMVVLDGLGLGIWVQVVPFQCRIG